MADIRNERTELALVDALLVLLKGRQLTDISVTELAAEAGVSRSTFYMHFPNVHAVFVRAVREFLQQSRTLSMQLSCSACGEEGPGVPFCIQLRRESRFQPLVTQPDFLPCYLGLSRHVGEGRILAELDDAGLPDEIIDAVVRFQLSGCYAVACTTKRSADWPRIQEALDTFIRGGLRALRAKG